MENKCSVVLGDVNEVTDFDHNSVGYYQTALHKSEKVLCGSWSWAVSQSWLICLSHPGQAWWDPEQFVEFEDSGLSQYSSTHELKKGGAWKRPFLHHQKQFWSSLWVWHSRHLALCFLQAEGFCLHCFIFNFIWGKIIYDESFYQCWWYLMRCL